jgi:hypothetical protein
VSIKEDIESIKSDMVGDGKSLEIVLKIERFIKKHRSKIYSTIAILIVIFIANIANNVMQESRKSEANSAYLTLLKEPSNSSARTTLQDKNPALLELITLKAAATSGDTATLETLTKSKTPIIASLANYQLLVIKNDTAALESYVLNDKALLKEFAILQLAHRYYENNEAQKAQDLLAQIPFTSMLKNSANSFEHILAK